LKTPISHMLLVLLASFIGSFGGVFLKSGAEQVREGLIYLFISRKPPYFNWRLACGVGMFLISSYFFVLGIRPPGELSVLYPMVSLGYIFTLLWSRIFFKEPLTRVKFLGLFLIVLGVVFVGMGSK
jgi:multidrug transporter EmrE-like cation transporter